jgi:EIX receptor 1/2
VISLKNICRIFFSLNELDLSFNSVSLKFSPNWVPPFHLNTIKLSSCKLGPAFPQWLQKQNNFSWLDMSDVGISNTIPNWFWDLSSNIKFLNLSHNQITGTIPRSWFLTRSTNILNMDLSYNRFNGPLPQFHFDSSVLNLSNNLFEGSITSICETSESGFMNANFMFWSYLDLSNNSLSGELPNCWGQMSLTVLNLGNNNFFGRIPNDICGSTRSELATLQLHNNNFIGELPKSMIAYSSLRVLDLGENTLWEDTNMDRHKPTKVGGSPPTIKLVQGSHTIAIMSSNIS